MIITCPSCSANYRLKAELINPVTGRVVRCSSCGNSWRVFPPSTPSSNTEIKAKPKVASRAKPKNNLNIPRKFSRKSNKNLWILTTILINILIFTFGYIFRKDIVKTIPQTERFYQLLGIDVNITGISLVMPYLEKINHENGDISLLIQGSFLNSHPKKTLKIMPLRITLLDSTNLPIETFTKSNFNPQFLLAGGRSDFTFKIEDLPKGAVDVRIEFDYSTKIKDTK